MAGLEYVIRASRSMAHIHSLVVSTIERNFSSLSRQRAFGQLSVGDIVDEADHAQRPPLIVAIHLAKVRDPARVPGRPQMRNSLT